MQPAAHSDQPATGSDGTADLAAPPAVRGPAVPGPAVPAATGNATIRHAGEDVTAQLDGLRQRPVHEHVEVYQGLHATLQAALAEIDSA